ncbi:MAG: ABC transporter ATP-binding protein [Vicingaceae bacterium]
MAEIAQHNQQQVMVEAKDLHLGFMVAKHGINNMKDFLFTFGIKQPFERKEVLKGVDLTIFKGESFGIMGRNGSGKSTLLRAISGIMKPESGSLKVYGKVAPMMALGVGLEPEMTGEENIKLLGILMGYSNREIKDSIDKIIEFSELSDDDIKSQVKRYSQGMMTRLTFSITVARDPEILIVDEALTVGDLGFKKKCAKRIMDIRDGGGTIIYVSHHLDEIKQICKRGCFLKDGKVMKTGNIEEIADLYSREVSKKRL